MPRIPYPDPDELQPSVKAAVDRAPFNVVRMLSGAAPAVFEGFSKFSGAFYGSCGLTPNLREVAILRVGYLSNAKYETFQHEPSGRLVGLTDGQIEAIRHGGQHPHVLFPQQQAVLDFTDDVVRNVRAGDETLAEVRKYLNDSQVRDLILLIGLYMAVSRFLETTGVELDDSAIDWKTLPKSQ
jgi:alkylhydroperoxidase family enzyme